MIGDFLSKVYQFNPVTKYLLNLTVFWPFLATDTLLNSILGGSPRETISGRLNRHRERYKWIVDILEWIDKDHCKKWERPEAVKEEVFRL